MGEQGKLSQWLEERCQREHLSLRKAGAKTGQSGVTISNIIRGSHPHPEIIRKLAQAFGGDGPNQRFALEDYLLTLAGYRSERPEGELTKPMAELMDKVKKFGEAQIRIMVRFADFLVETEGQD